MQLSCKMIRLDSHRRRLDPRPPHKAPCLVDCEFGNYWEVGCISTNFGNSHVFWWIGARVTYSYCACIRTCILDQTESSKPGCTWGATFDIWWTLDLGKTHKIILGRTVTARKGFPRWWRLYAHLPWSHKGTEISFKTTECSESENIVIITDNIRIS